MFLLFFHDTAVVGLVSSLLDSPLYELSTRRKKVSDLEGDEIEVEAVVETLGFALFLARGV